MAKKYARKIDKQSWLTDESMPLAERIEIGLAEFDDPEKCPSVYTADTEAELVSSLAAQAWYRRERAVGRIENTRYVIVAEGQLTRAGLQLVPQESTIPWRCLKGKHFVLTAGAEPCSADDLRRLVAILIDEHAFHGTRRRAELQQAAKRELEAER